MLPCDSRWIQFVAFGCALGVLTSSPGLIAADKPPDSSSGQIPRELSERLEALEKSQRQIQQDLAEIKALLRGDQSRIVVPPKQSTPVSIPVNVHGEPYRGDAKARVGLMEYSDFECSHCARSAREWMPRVQRDFIQNGRVKYFFRDMPSPDHTNSLFKARIARCAGEQGKFWEMHDRLFADFESVAPLDPAALARSIGLDVPRFTESLQSGRHTDIIRRSAAGAPRLGVYGTPAFLMGTLDESGDFLTVTRVLVGGETYEAIQSALESILSGTSK